MSDYTPDEDYIVAQYVNSAEAAVGGLHPEFEAEARRGIARIKAEAWDEGNRAGVSDQAAWDGWRYYPHDKHPIPNPYRNESSDE